MVSRSPGRSRLGSPPMTSRFARYQYGQATAILRSVASGPSRSPVIRHSESPGRTSTLPGARGFGSSGGAGVVGSGAWTTEGGTGFGLVARPAADLLPARSLSGNPSRAGSGSLSAQPGADWSAASVSTGHSIRDGSLGSSVTPASVRTGPAGIAVMVCAALAGAVITIGLRAMDAPAEARTSRLSSSGVNRRETAFNRVCRCPVIAVAKVASSPIANHNEATHRSASAEEPTAASAPTRASQACGADSSDLSTPGEGLSRHAAKQSSSVRTPTSGLPRRAAMM
jgi:hypothetical protein